MDRFINGNDIYEYIKMRSQLDGRVSLGELMTIYDDPLFVVTEVDELEQMKLIKRDYVEDVEIFYRAV